MSAIPTSSMPGYKKLHERVYLISGADGANIAVVLKGCASLEIT